MSADDSDKLLNFITGVLGDEVIKVEEDLGHGYVRLNLREAELRQARHDIQCVEDCLLELLRNSRDAGARRIFIASRRDGAGLRRLTVIDDGEGVPDAVREKIFEPRVTSRLKSVIEDAYGVHGRGMALFSIKQLASDFKLVQAAPRLGAVFSLSVDTSELKEVSDQSTWPIKKKTSSGTLYVGPHNLIRTAAEFADRHPDISLFIGTPAEIITALITAGRRSGEIMEPAAESDLPYWLRPSLMKDADKLVSLARKCFDINISSRNAYRVLTGAIQSAAALGGEETPSATSGGVDVSDGRRHLTKNIALKDRRAFTQAIAQNFRSLGEKYFIALQGEPEIKFERRRITIRINLTPDDDSEI